MGRLLKIIMVQAMVDDAIVALTCRDENVRNIAAVLPPAGWFPAAYQVCEGCSHAGVAASRRAAAL